MLPALTATAQYTLLNRLNASPRLEIYRLLYVVLSMQPLRNSPCGRAPKSPRLHMADIRLGSHLGIAKTHPDTAVIPSVTTG